MEKLLITLKVPCVQQKYDVMIPDFLEIKEIVNLLSDAVSNLTQHMYVSSGKEVLCRDDPAMILNKEYTLRDYGIEHGECLYLF